MFTKNENDFDALARIYDKLGFMVFGDTILQSQRAFLSHIAPHSTVLFIGGGTGKILPELCQRQPCKILYVEKSAKMLALAQRHVTDAAPIEWILGEENHPDIQSQSFDVILTFFLLDLFDESSLQELMQKLSQTLKPEGLWLVSDFNPDASSLFSKLIYRSMYTFFRLTSRVRARQLPDYPAVFTKLGFTSRHRKLFYSDMIQALIYQRPT